MSKPGLAEQLINSPFAAKLGVPQGEKLRRYSPDQPLLDGPVVISGKGRVANELPALLTPDYKLLDEIADTKRSAIVMDATEIERPEDLHQLFDALHPQMRKLRASARVVIVGTTPELTETADARIAARALEGFSRSVGKELRYGATAQLVYLAPDASVENAESTFRFLLSGKSAFVSGQVIRVDGTEAPKPADWTKPLEGRTAVVTGAARGIGETIAEVLSRDGAKVICVDIPAAGEGLAETANKVKGISVPLDVTDPQAADKLAEYGPIDIIVHNAGVTRDKLLANMDEARWNMVQNINLVAPVRITEKLMELGALADDAAVIGVSSMAGIAGNRGQTNYATTKAGVIGMVDALAPVLAEKGGTINAVAPGFIETAMTAAMPTGPREVGRRINSLQQGGLPVDVAETVAYFAAGASRAVNGNVVRVCGQNQMGA